MLELPTLFVLLLLSSLLSPIQARGFFASPKSPNRLASFYRGFTRQSYSQPLVDKRNNDGKGLPGNRAYSDPKTFILAEDFEVTDVPKTREYWFEIGTSTANPDGYTRQILTVNNQFPGPLIEVNYGDTLIVHVHNTLETPQSIHWHGLNQNGTNYMDGTPGITQCPIPPGGSFTYEFPINNRWGTYWWHAHYSNTLQEGIYGPLIIHAPDEPVRRYQDYDEDRIIILGDWWFDDSEVIVAGLTSLQGYRGTTMTPNPDTLLINGIGEANCSSEFYPPGAECNPPPRPEVFLPINKRVRIRFINVASFSHLRVSIDEHELEVVEADSTPIYGPTIHEVPISEAQRYSVIVNTNKGKKGDKFWLRVNQATLCHIRQAPQWALGVITYGDGNEKNEGNEGDLKYPTTKEWPDLLGYDQPCRDLDERYTLSPRSVRDAYTPTFTSYPFSSKAGLWTLANGQLRGGFSLNNISYQNVINDPVLEIVEREGSFDRPYVSHFTAYEDGEMDIIINNLDPIDHPFHVHGNDFQIIQRGFGNFTTDDEIQELGFVTASNPLRRDTIWIPGLSYAILRFRTDNPGVWTLHCHIGWHLSQGKLGVIIIRPDVIQQRYARPQSWQNLCAGEDRAAIGPNRRELKTESSLWDFKSIGRLRHKLLSRYGARD